MKIEKLSDSQIKFTLDQDDLRERDLQIIELIHSPEKAREIILEMMDQALIEHDFQADNTPLMIEAMPSAPDGIVIIITKMPSTENMESRLSRLSSLFDLPQDRPNMPEIGAHANTCHDELFFKFDTLDRVSMACNRLLAFYAGCSVLYKKDGKYYLWLHDFTNEKLNIPTTSFSHILAEYGNLEHSAPLNSTYLLEHGEIIIKESAVQIMANI